MSQEVVKVNHLCKTIGKRKILQDVTFTVNEGEAIGIVGCNGSGKSMLFKSMCNLVIPTSGEVVIFDQKVGKHGKFPKDVGVLIESPGFLPQFSGLRNLKLLAGIRNVISEKEVEDTIRLVGLDPTDKRPIKKYSMGMRQRLSIAQALMEHPKLLILDEPMNGLDQKGVGEIRQVLEKLRKEQQVTLILTSHHADDIEALCEKVYTMEDGVLQPSA